MTPRTLPLLFAALAGCAHASTPCPATPAPPAQEVPLADPITAPRQMTVTSTDFLEGAEIPVANSFGGFGCTGANTSPQLSWTGAPAATRSFALVVHDPDAPTGVGFFHWIVADLPAATTSLASGAAASLAQGVVAGHTDFGTNTYGGPCPPPGAPHHYYFTVYALDVPTLGLTEAPSGALLRFMLRAHTIAYGRLSGTFHR